MKATELVTLLQRGQAELEALTAFILEHVGGAPAGRAAGDAMGAYVISRRQVTKLSVAFWKTQKSKRKSPTFDAVTKGRLTSLETLQALAIVVGDWLEPGRPVIGEYAPKRLL